MTTDNFAFLPTALQVKVGQEVTWTTQQDVAHTVTADEGAFAHSMPAGPGSHCLHQAGSFAYHCTVHPAMHATIVGS